MPRICLNLWHGPFFFFFPHDQSAETKWFLQSLVHRRIQGPCSIFEEMDKLDLLAYAAWMLFPCRGIFGACIEICQCLPWKQDKRCVRFIHFFLSFLVFTRINLHVLFCKTF